MFSNLWNKGGFILCTKGQAELSINGVRYNFSQGEVLVITPLVLVGEVSVSEEFAALSFVDDLKTYYDIFSRVADSPIPLMVYREPIWKIEASEQLYLTKQYAHLEQQTVAGENIASSRSRIEGILDKLVQGFEKQLDILFKSDAVDITSDIKTLEKMLEMDGLNR